MPVLACEQAPRGWGWPRVAAPTVGSRRRAVAARYAASAVPIFPPRSKKTARPPLVTDPKGTPDKVFAKRRRCRLFPRHVTAERDGRQEQTRGRAAPRRSQQEHPERRPARPPRVRRQQGAGTAVGGYARYTRCEGRGSDLSLDLCASAVEEATTHDPRPTTADDAALRRQQDVHCCSHLSCFTPESLQCAVWCMCDAAPNSEPAELRPKLEAACSSGLRCEVGGPRSEVRGRCPQ